MITPERLGALLTVLTIVGMLGGFYFRKIRPRARETWADVKGVLVTINGADPVIDPRTGEERAPKIPGIVELNADTQKAVKDLSGTVQELANSVKILIDRDVADLRADVASLKRGQENHEGRITNLEDGRVERALGRVASAAELTAIAKLRGDQDVVEPPEELPPSGA